MTKDEERMSIRARVEAAGTIEVACPHCAARWALPAERIGPGGARVHCARCEGAFEWRVARRAAGFTASQTSAVVERAAVAAPAPPAPGVGPGLALAAFEDGLSSAELDTWLEDVAVPPPPVSAVDELDASDVTPELVARLAVEELVGTRADELLDAYDQGTLFARFGPALIGAWSRCRARLGADGDPEAFRAALRARIGIDLPGWEERG